jgi:hypothetical protein
MLFFILVYSTMLALILLIAAQGQMTMPGRLVVEHITWPDYYGCFAMFH